MENEPTIAVFIPCYNEAPTIGQVVRDFRAQLPDAEIVVFDNGSTDESARRAQDAGATVVKEPRKGKGFVVASLLDRAEADYCVMADADGQHPAEKVHELLAPVMAGDADMAVGARVADPADRSAPAIRRLGNRLVRYLTNRIFGAELTDILSGYRAFNRKVVRRIPVISYGFEVETELTIQMLYYRLKIVEVPVPVRPRAAASDSKVRAVRDGVRMLWKIFSLFRWFRPLTFFGGLAILLFLLGLFCGIAPIRDYLTHPQHHITHIAQAILATGLMILAAGSAFLGLLLHALNWRFIEVHEILGRGKS